MIFEIFKTGEHTNSNGVKKNFTLSDLNHIVKTFKPGERDVPLVLGHPKNNDPAFGWVEKLFVKGKSLFAKSKDEDPEFIKAVKNKKFPKRSISLTSDGRLNHIGFLGAVLPAVDGLSPVKFNSDEDSFLFEIDEELNFEISDDDKENENIESSVNKSLKKENSNSLKPNQNNPSFTLDSYSKVLEDISETIEQIKNVQTAFANNFQNNFNAELTDKERNKIRNDLDTLKMKMETANFEVLLNEKLLYGSLTPVMKTKINKTLKFLNNQNFQDFDSEKFILELKTQLMDFINSIPKIVTFEDFADKPTEEPTEKLVDEDYGGLAVDEVQKTTHKKVLNKMKENNIDYSSALKIVLNS